MLVHSSPSHNRLVYPAFRPHPEWGALPLPGPHRFVEHGEYRGNYYGTSLESVRSVLSKNKVCLLDVQPHVSDCPTGRQSDWPLVLRHVSPQAKVRLHLRNPGLAFTPPTADFVLHSRGRCSPHLADRHFH